jgi:hypothetical protein
VRSVRENHVRRGSFGRGLGGAQAFQRLEAVHLVRDEQACQLARVTQRLREFLRHTSKFGTVERTACNRFWTWNPMDMPSRAEILFDLIRKRYTAETLGTWTSPINTPVWL